MLIPGPITAEHIECSKKAVSRSVLEIEDQTWTFVLKIATFIFVPY